MINEKQVKSHLYIHIKTLLIRRYNHHFATFAFTFRLLYVITKLRIEDYISSIFINHHKVTGTLNSIFHGVR